MKYLAKGLTSMMYCALQLIEAFSIGPIGFWGLFIPKHIPAYFTAVIVQLHPHSGFYSYVLKPTRLSRLFGITQVKWS